MVVLVVPLVELVLEVLLVPVAEVSVDELVDSVSVDTVPVALVSGAT
ncbi:MAG TPA: hypothetical protein VN181_03175 [Thermoanaerobaculia bacterium]|nr:hypothetical protein [Thermoanaerobaculia bacterium]